VLRGGSWYYYADLARCAGRNSNTPALAVNYSGFRCVRGF
jgi:formylglycine-generating enzyme required for sulfatase activity